MLKTETVDVYVIPEPLVSFPIVIKIWGSVETALSFTSQEQDLTFPHPDT